MRQLILHDQMKRLKPLFLYLLFPFLLFMTSCSDEQAEENERLRNKIIEVHDDAMAKIGTMYLLEKKLKPLKNKDTAHNKLASETIDNLQLANKMMFDWMHQYQTLAVDDNLRIDNEYRREQLELITEVKVLTDTSIKTAEDLLENESLPP